MATRTPHWDRDRLLAAAGAVAVQALLGWALIVGLAVHFPRAADDALKLFAAEPPPPPPPVRPEPPRKRTERAEGAASPVNLRSRATEVAAPIPIVIAPPPTPIVAAPKPFVQSDWMSGSADVRGPGTGSGGVGEGFGSGGRGDGDGGGFEDDETPPRLIRGRMDTSDIPQALVKSGFDGEVGVRYVVAVDGRVPSCSVTRSSGNAQVDALTCRLIRERFRFRPSRDGRGRAVAATIVESHAWVIEDDPDARRR